MDIGHVCNFQNMHGSNEQTGRPASVCNCASGVRISSSQQRYFLSTFLSSIVNEIMKNSDEAFLDQTQYTPENIEHYETIFGKQFIATGGDKFLDYMTGFLNIKPLDSVLEFGTGLGGFAFHLASKHQAKVLGVDISKNMISKANIYLKDASSQIKENVTLELRDVMKEPFPSASFQFVVAREVVVHIREKEALLQNFWNWLKPGGKLLISDYCLGSNPHTEDFQEYLKDRQYAMISLTEYKSTLEKVGFVLTTVQNMTTQCIGYLTEEINQLKINKTDLSKTLSTEQYEKLVSGWERKLHRCVIGNQEWGLIVAMKPE